jgi:hypothetical protein
MSRRGGVDTTSQYLTVLWRKRGILVCMTTEMSFLSPNPPRPHPPRSHLHTGVCRCIASRNPNWHSWTNSVRLTYLSVYDSRDGVSELSPSPSPPSSLTDVHIIQSHTLPTPTFLTFMCTQVLWCLVCLVRSRVTMTPNTRSTIFSTHVTQCMWDV